MVLEDGRFQLPTRGIGASGCLLTYSPHLLGTANYQLKKL
jgi:hypothetical protein